MLTYVNTCLVSISLDSSNETRYHSIYFLDIVRVLNKFIVQKHDNANVKEMFSVLVVKLVSYHTKQYTDAITFSIQSCRSCYATQHLCQRSFYKIFVIFRNTKKKCT